MGLLSKTDIDAPQMRNRGGCSQREHEIELTLGYSLTSQEKESL